MPESIDDLRTKKDSLQKTANELKDKRNKLHAKSKKLAEERDLLNSTIRKLRNEISEHKKLRDDLNERVKHAKEQRDALNEQCQAIKRNIKKIERQRSQGTGINVSALRKQLHTLETEQMTQPMSPQKEKKIVEIIRDLHAKIKKQEELLSKDPKLKKAFEEEESYKKKAEKQHDAVENLASRAQQEHEIMINLITKLDNHVKKVNIIQDKIVTTKIEADDVHKNFIKHVDNIHELEREISQSSDQFIRKRKKADESHIYKEANEIFERFKRGEKLSTEDLMALQKAGLI